MVKLLLRVEVDGLELLVAFARWTKYQRIFVIRMFSSILIVGS